jgi:hypothetical protein
MAQKQIAVPLILLHNNIGEAVATGNNAAWHCKCERKLPLLGRSGKVSDGATGYLVICPNCDRHYYVMPEGKDQGRVLHVKEVEK